MLLQFLIIIGGKRIDRTGLRQRTVSRWARVSVINEPRTKGKKRRLGHRCVRHSSFRSLFIPPLLFISNEWQKTQARLKTFPLDRPGCRSSRRKYRAWILLPLVKSWKVSLVYLEAREPVLPTIDCKEILTTEMKTTLSRWARPVCNVHVQFN